jgi:hypothetical protein
VRTPRCAIVGATLASFLLPGCGGEPESHPFKETDTAPLKSMQDEMIKNLKTKSYMKRATPPQK